MIIALILATASAACAALSYEGHVLAHRQDALLSGLVSVLCAGGAVHAIIGAIG